MKRAATALLCFVAIALPTMLAIQLVTSRHELRAERLARCTAELELYEQLHPAAHLATLRRRVVDVDDLECQVVDAIRAGRTR